MEPPIEPFSYYVSAFSELNSCRPSSFGVAPIPFTAIVEYFKIWGGNDGEDFDEFHYYIRVMDNALLKMESDKQKQQQKASTSVKSNASKGNSRKG